MKSMCKDAGKHVAIVNLGVREVFFFKKLEHEWIPNRFILFGLIRVC